MTISTKLVEITRTNPISSDYWISAQARVIDGNEEMRVAIPKGGTAEKLMHSQSKLQLTGQYGEAAGVGKSFVVHSCAPEPKSPVLQIVAD